MSDLPSEVRLGDVLQVSLRGAGAVGAGHYLPGLARRAHAAGGGPSP